MIRLIIIFLGLLLIWLLFFSGFNKQRKILFSAFIVLFAGLGIWYEQSGKTPRANLVETGQVFSCGVSAQHSYRTNYDIEFCLQNNSDYELARVGLDFMVSKCLNGNCTEVQAVHKEFPVKLLAGQQAKLTENLNFDQVSETDTGLVWTSVTKTVKARR